MGMQDDYFSGDIGNYFYQTKAEKILSIADVSNPHELLAELSQKSVYMLEHESESYNTIVEVTRLVALAVTFFFLCYWCWSMRFESDGFDCGISSSNNATNATERGIRSFARELIQSVSRSWTRSDGQHTLFWWESPWIIFPERRYLLLLLVSLLMLQNPLLAYAFFHPSLYCSADFRCAADSLSGVSIHGILFFWLCLVNGLRYQ